MYNIPSVRSAQIELSSRCNASCPACSRNISGGPLAPGLVPEDLSLDDIKNMFDTDILKNMHMINYCGNLGDPGINKDLYEIVSYIKENASPKLSQLVRTNGGMRTPDFWAKLGNFFKKTFDPYHPFEHSGVVFSVDGLADTNHIYRRGVVWDKVWSNMQAYSAAGGYGVWEFLIFDHNKHQVKEAEQMAKELGFTFLVKTPVGFGETDGVKRPLRVLNRDGEYDYSIWPHDWTGAKEEPSYPLKYMPSAWKKTELTEYSQKLSVESTIKCKSLQYKDSQEIFITASGHLLPCCYIGSALGQRDTTYSRYQFNQKFEETGADIFDLRKHSISEILNNHVFQDFFVKSWEKESARDGKLLFCTEICGECSSIDKIYSEEHRQKSFGAK
jgi:MoaA/NifB/PqqE/SkfB family radical SAM enzyme